MSLSDIFGSANKKSYASFYLHSDICFLMNLTFFQNQYWKNLIYLWIIGRIKKITLYQPHYSLCKSLSLRKFLDERIKTANALAASIHKFNSRISKALMDRFSICINIDMPSQFDRKDASYDLEKVSKNINRAWKNQEKGIIIKLVSITAI